MERIKVVARDVYGTLIASPSGETRDDVEYETLMPREGALEALTEIKNREIVQCTCSDGDLVELRKNLQEAGIDRGFFNDLFRMEPWHPKDFTFILEDYGLEKTPKKLLVIGNNYDIDISFAKQQGCSVLWVPEYIDRASQKIDVRKILEIISM